MAVTWPITFWHHPHTHSNPHTCSKALQMLWSSNTLKGSTLYRTGPLNSTGSWGIMDILVRTSCSPRPRHSTSSILILPIGSASLKKEDMREDFPAPVLPTIPIWGQGMRVANSYIVYTFSPGIILKLRPFKTKGPVSEWRYERSLTVMPPFTGQSDGGFLSGGWVLREASGSSFPYAITLSAETI